MNEDRPETEQRSQRGKPRTPRTVVYHAIDTERLYQDRMLGNSFREDIDAKRDLGSLVLLMDIYLSKAKAQFGGPSSEENDLAVLDILRKVAGLAVTAMEYHGAPLREA